MLSPNQSGKPKSMFGWAFCARTAARDLFLLYFEKECPRATLTGTKPGGRYQARWFYPQNGEWNNEGVPLVADAAGSITLPPYPEAGNKSETDWALRLTLTGPVE